MSSEEEPESTPCFDNKFLKSSGQDMTMPTLISSGHMMNSTKTGDETNELFISLEPKAFIAIDSPKNEKEHVFDVQFPQ